MPAIMQRLTLRHETLSNREYHARPELGSTTLKTLDRDGAEIVAAKLADPQRSDARSLAVGSAIHAVIDGTFHDLFECAPDARGFKTTDSDTFAKAALDADARGVTLLTQAEWNRVQASGDAVKRKLGNYLVGRQYWREPSLFWSQPVEGFDPVPCKCRPDILVDHGDDSATYIELKSAADNCPAAFRSAFWRYGYLLQQAHYEAGIRASSNCSLVRTGFVVVRTSWPYTVRTYDLDELDAAAGARKWRELLREYARRSREYDWEDDTFLAPTRLTLGIKCDDDLEDME